MVADSVADREGTFDITLPPSLCWHSLIAQARDSSHFSSSTIIIIIVIHFPCGLDRMPCPARLLACLPLENLFYCPPPPPPLIPFFALSASSSSARSSDPFQLFHSFTSQTQLNSTSAPSLYSPGVPPSKKQETHPKLPRVEPSLNRIPSTAAAACKQDSSGSQKSRKSSPKTR